MQRIYAMSYHCGHSIELCSGERTPFVEMSLTLLFFNFGAEAGRRRRLESKRYFAPLGLTELSCVTRVPAPL